MATPIPVSDDPATPVVTPCTDLSESPSSQGLPPMPYSVPVSEHMDECSKDELGGLLDCNPKKVSEVNQGQMSEEIYQSSYSTVGTEFLFLFLFFTCVLRI